MNSAPAGARGGRLERVADCESEARENVQVDYGEQENSCELQDENRVAGHARKAYGRGKLQENVGWKREENNEWREQGTQEGSSGCE